MCPQATNGFSKNSPEAFPGHPEEGGVAAPIFIGAESDAAEV